MIFRKFFCNPGLFWKELKRTKYIMLLHTLLLALSTTLPAVLISENYKNNEIINADERIKRILEQLAAANEFILIVEVAAVFGTVYFLLSYLFDKRSVIFYGSMPEKKSCIFMTKVCVAVAALVIPVLAVTAINLIFAAVLSVGSYWYIVKHFLFLMYHYLFLAAAISCAASVAGNFLAMLTAAGFGFLLYPTVLVTVAGNIEVWFKTYGVRLNADIYYIFPPALSYNTSDVTAKYVIFEAAATVLLFVFGALFCAKRRAENTDKFFAFGFVKSIIKYVTTAFGAALLGAFVAETAGGSAVISYVIYLLFAFLIYIVLNAMFEKSFKAMFTKLKSFAVFAVIFAAAISVPVLDSLGLDSYVPKEADFVSFTPTNDFSYIRFSDSDYNCTLRDKDNINAVLDFARDSVEALEKGDFEGKYYDEFCMRFGKLPFGIYRKFPCDYNNASFEACFNAIYESEEYKQSLANAVGILSVDGEEGNYGNFHIDTICPYYIYGDFNEKLVEDLRKVLKSDIEKYSYEEIKASERFGYIYSYAISGPDITIYDCYDDTVEYLLENYFYIPALEIITLKNPENGKTVVISDLDEIKDIFRASEYYYENEENPEENIAEIYVRDEIVAGVKLERLFPEIKEKLN